MQFGLDFGRLSRYIYNNNATFFINFRREIENEVSNYRLLRASSFYQCQIGNINKLIISLTISMCRVIQVEMLIYFIVMYL
jgi:hypothetical protein